MRPPRFALSSEQCELLAAFEIAPSLEALATTLGREVSVVSRQIKRLGEAAPVLEKAQGRWRITPLGRQLAAWSREAMIAQHQMIDQQSLRMSAPSPAEIPDDAALVLVGCQRGFHDPRWGARNQPHAEERIAALLAHWRTTGRGVFHVVHASREPGSPFAPDHPGHRVMAFAAPRRGEHVVAKSRHSGFVATELEAALRAGRHSAIVLVGFTLTHCVNTTARSASDLGLTVYVVADATVTFARLDIDGRLLEADDLHTANLASLSQEIAVVVSSSELLARGALDPPREVWRQAAR